MFLVRYRKRSDEGQALVLVLTMMVLVGSIIAIIAVMAVHGLNFTTQTRASAQSVSAAEAGIDMVGAQIMSENCEDVVPNPADGIFSFTHTVPAYEGQVWRQPSSADDFIPGCPSSTDYAYKVVSTGYAQQLGSAGYDLGDTETLEAVWVKLTPAPRFDDAVYGHSYVGTRGMAGIFSEEGDASVFTSGDFECPSAITIEGSLVVEGDAVWKNQNCRIDGNVYVGGSVQFSNDTKNAPNVGGDLFVEGNLTYNLSKGHGQFITGYWSDTRVLGVGGDIRVGGLIDAYCMYDGAAPNSDWDGFNKSGSDSDLANCASGSDTRVQMRVPDLSIGPTKDFIVLTPESAPYASWTQVPWDEHGTGRVIASGQCDHADPGHGPGYSGPGGSAVIDVSENTVIDTTAACPSGVLLGDYGGLTINLEADLAILANSFVRNGNVTINSVDGKKHSLYIIDPLPSGTPDDWTCPSPVPGVGPNGGIDITGGQPWAQDDDVAVMMYTHGLIDAHSSIEFAGQVYGCRADLVSGFSMTYRPVGDASASDGLDSFDVKYVRRSS